MTEPVPNPYPLLLTEPVIAAPIDAVWRALREPETILQWFGWDAETLAEEVKFIFVDGAMPNEVSHSIDFGEWQGISDRFELAAVEGGTVFRILRRGTAAGTDYARMFDEIAEGWVTFAQQLRLMLAFHQGETRRTIYLSGKARPGQSPPRTALRIAGLMDAKPGRSYAAKTPLGEIDGKVWHDTTYQVGLHVAQWGDGLLVVMDRPDGGGHAVLTTYGLSDDAFAALSARWREWWEGHYTA